MQELLDKIKEFTIDGSPSVGQWIELGDLAKKHGIAKTEMEKMVSKALEKPAMPKPEFVEDKENIRNEYSFDRDREYVRPDLELSRANFEREMLERRERDALMFNRDEESSIPEIEQPEVTFPELNVDFDQTKIPSFEESVPPKIELEQEELIKPIESVQIPPNQEEIVTPEINQEEFKIELEEPTTEMVFEDISKTNFEFNPEEFQAKVEADHIADYIAESNKRALKEAEEREKILKEEEEKERKLNEQRKTKPKQNSSQTSRKSPNRQTSDYVTHDEAKKARTIGIVAAIAGLIFGVVGLIIGFYGLGQANKLKAQIDQSANLYGDEIRQNVGLAKGLSVAGIVIGGIRVFSFIIDLF